MGSKIVFMDIHAFFQIKFLVFRPMLEALLPPTLLARTNLLNARKPMSRIGNISTRSNVGLTRLLFANNGRLLPFVTQNSTTTPAVTT